MPQPPEKKPEVLSKREVVALEMFKIAVQYSINQTGNWDLNNTLPFAFKAADYFFEESKNFSI
jgi:hypothetical protein